MKTIGFVYGEKVTNYEYTRNRVDVISMRDNYLHWISHYRENKYRICYQDQTSVFKSMCSTKVCKESCHLLLKMSTKFLQEKEHVL